MLASIECLDNKIISGKCDKTIRIWDIYCDLCLMIIERHKREITSLLIINKINIIISSSFDKTVKCLNIDGNCIKELDVFTSLINTIIKSNHEEKIYIASEYIHCYDINNIL